MSVQCPTSTGLLTNFKCPWCSEREDLSDIEEQIEPGCSIECTSCGGLYEITAVAEVKQLWAAGIDDEKMS